MQSPPNFKICLLWQTLIEQERPQFFFNKRKVVERPFLPHANEVCEGYVFTGVCHSFCSRGGRAWLLRGVCVVLFGGHAWFYSGGGMHGFIWGGMCGFIRGACVVLLWGACMVLFGGHAWFYLGGMHGFIRGGVRGFIWGGMRGFIQGGRAWFFQFFRIQ